MLPAVPVPVGPTTITTLIGVAAATAGTATSPPRLSNPAARRSARAPVTSFDARWAPLVNQPNVLPPHYQNAAHARRTLYMSPGRVEKGWGGQEPPHCAAIRPCHWAADRVSPLARCTPPGKHGPHSRSVPGTFVPVRTR